MTITIDRLLSLRVADVMNRNVVQIAAQQTMAEAAQKLIEHKVSGAPVVDAQGRCVGMLSATDFMRCEMSGNGKLDQHLVQQYMSGPVQSIAALAFLAEATRVMCRSHVHRLPVVDGAGRVTGIISSLDVVAAVMNAAEEMEQ